MKRVIDEHLECREKARVVLTSMDSSIHSLEDAINHLDKAREIVKEVFASKMVEK